MNELRIFRLNKRDPTDHLAFILFECGISEKYLKYCLNLFKKKLEEEIFCSPSEK